MTFSLKILPEVEEDAFNAYLWYEAKSPGLGEDFLNRLYACLEDLPQHPLRYPKIHEEFRRCLLRRFPYALYFSASNTQIIIVGLFHCARNPLRINGELHKRKKNP